MKLNIAALVTAMVVSISVPVVAQTAAPRSQVDVLERISAAARQQDAAARQQPANTYDTFLALLRTAGITEFLPGKTLVAPSDAAFERIGPQVAAALQAPDGRDTLKAFIDAHTIDQIALPETITGCICVVGRPAGAIRIGALQPAGLVVDIDGRLPAWTNGDSALVTVPPAGADKPGPQNLGAVLGIRSILHFAPPAQPKV
jgi:uncharacterized surface protein with fasciclin (FAS1) repeats